MDVMTRTHAHLDFVNPEGERIFISFFPCSVNLQNASQDIFILPKLQYKISPVTPFITT